jgi:hypothetical protein
LKTNSFINFKKQSFDFFLIILEEKSHGKPTLGKGQNRIIRSEETSIILLRSIGFHINSFELAVLRPEYHVGALGVSVIPFNHNGKCFLVINIKDDTFMGKLGQGSRLQVGLFTEETIP